MPVIRVEPGKLGVVIKMDARNIPKIFRKGAMMGAHRGRTHMVANSPVDRGLLKNAWEVHPGFGNELAELINTSPYAGVLERGARPGAKFSPQVVDDLAQWVIRKILRARMAATRPRARAPKIGSARWTAEQAEARSIAFAILTKWQKLGREGTFFVKAQQNKLSRFAVEEIVREINKYFASGGGTSGNV